MGSRKHPGVHLLPTNVCPVVPLSILSAGARFEFIDLDPITLHMSREPMLRRVRDPGAEPVSSVVFVRTYGVESDVEPIFEDLRNSNPRPLIVDDRCLCVALTEPRELGSQTADVVIFSTGRAKQVDLGFGGFAHLRSEVSCPDAHREYSADHHDRISRLLNDQARSQQPLYRGSDSSVVREMANAKWLDLSRPVLSWDAYRQQVGDAIAKRERHREKINEIYRRSIPEQVQLGESFHRWRFQIRVAESKSLIENIFEAGYFASRHYFPSAVLFGDQPAPVATRLSESIVNLFNDFHVSADGALRISEIVRHHVRGRPTPPLEGPE